MKKTQELKYEIKFDLETLDLLYLCILTDRKEISVADLTDLQSLMNLIQEDIYRNDMNLYARFLFIKYALQAKLEKRYKKESIIIDYCRTNMSELSLKVLEDQILPTLEEGEELNTEEIQYIKGIIYRNLKYIYIYKYKDQILEMSRLLEDDVYNSDLDTLNQKFESILTSATQDLLTVQLSTGQEEEFDLFDLPKRNTQIDSLIQDRRKPEAMLKTGYQYLNKMLGGGFRKKRVYGFFGITGGFKSGLLINLLRGLKVHNNYNSPKGLIPTILYITQENSVDESIERLYSCMSGEDIANFEIEEVNSMFQESGMDRNTSNINIKMIFIPAMSKNTNVFREYYHKYRERGYDVICIMHDYVKTMRPVLLNSDLRIQMGNIITEMKVIATELNIPIITVGQLNREAAKTIDSSVGSSKADITRMLGKSNVGESWSMMEEFDWAAVINQEHHDILDTNFLVFKNIKARYLKTVLGYFAQPFDRERSFFLTEDEGQENPAGLLTMKATMSDLDENQANGGRRKSAIERKELDEQKKYEKETESSFSKFVSI